ncbi:MAG: murein biosynthesis integral membrane protein MurJ [Phycisphaerales bacterium]|nr:murein biosynthesis integral membrane protein MurJ [Planctomycetota bacterium]MCH8509461.1 murein biosynthesis integral membrane protein MurJ [Phycisphaerales bacterium]
MNAAEREHADATMGRDTRTVAGLTLGSRVLGLARDLVTVRVFGDTAVGSAFAAAFAIPNMFRRLFGEGALSAAFIPEYTRLADDDPDRADKLASLVIGMLALITGAITALLMLGILAVLLLAPGSDERVLSLRLVMICLPFMPLICVAAILGGMLQARGRFGPWAAAPIILNVCIIAVSAPYFVLGGDPAAWAYPIAAAATVSGVLQVLWSLWALRGMVRWTRAVSDVHGQARAMLRRMVPVLIGLGTLQLNAFMDTLIAMWPNWVGPTVAGYDYPLDERANAVLFYAQRLYQFPLGVFGIAVATAAFPMLARHAGDPARFVATLRRGLRLSLFIALPATVGLLVVREPLVGTLYSGIGDGFSDEGVRRAGLVLLGYAAAVWAYSLNQLYTRAFYAAGDTATPMRIAVSMVGFNLTLNCVLIWFLAEAGLAWSTAISATLQTWLLARAARRRLVGESLLDAETGRSVLGHIAAALAVGAATGGLLLAWAPPESWAWGAVRLAAAVGLGMAVYAGQARVRRLAELRWLLGRSVGNTMAH